jgi:hypothetical protein
MKKFLSKVLNNLRPYWLVFRRELKAAFTVCQKCKAFGAHPCSICACVPLCFQCSMEESIKLDRYKTTADYLKDGGIGAAS